MDKYDWIDAQDLELYQSLQQCAAGEIDEIDQDLLDRLNELFDEIPSVSEEGLGY